MCTIVYPYYVAVTRNIVRLILNEYFQVLLFCKVYAIAANNRYLLFRFIIFYTMKLQYSYLNTVKYDTYRVIQTCFIDIDFIVLRICAIY